MKRLILIVFLSVMLFILGCSEKEKEIEQTLSIPEVMQGSSGDAVFVHITQNGIATDSSEVVISNFRPGAKAEMTYRIHNGTTAAMLPEIYFVDYADVTDYSQADGAVKAPPEVIEWLKIPKLDEIKPGDIKDYTVVIEIPKDAENLPDKFGFQIQVAGNTGGMVQTAIGIWWLVNMK